MLRQAFNRTHRKTRTGRIGMNLLGNLAFLTIFTIAGFCWGFAYPHPERLKRVHAGDLVEVNGKIYKLVEQSSKEKQTN